MASPVYLIAGLGNPGTEYEDTRHNIGFSVLERFASQQGWALNQKRMQGMFCKQRHLDRQVLLVEPQTYMNRSGQCIRQFMDYFGVHQDHLLILHDDLDMPVGRIKVVARGGAGGHNGIRSVVQHLGHPDFARLKIGIGRPADHGLPGMAVERFVLGRITAAESAVHEQKVDLALEAIELFLSLGVEACMNRINGR